MPRPQVQALPTDFGSLLMLSGRGAAAAWPPPQQQCGDMGCLPPNPACPAGWAGRHGPERRSALAQAPAVPNRKNLQEQRPRLEAKKALLLKSHSSN